MCMEHENPYKGYSDISSFSLPRYLQGHKPVFFFSLKILVLRSFVLRNAQMGSNTHRV